MVAVKLSQAEVDILDRQAAAFKSKGGWQNLLVTLQERVNRSDRSLNLEVADIERICRYAFSYGHGGWEDRLRAIFSRSLGPELGHQFLDSGRTA